MDLIDLTVHELVDKLEKDEIKSEDIIKKYSENIEKREKDIQAFVTVLTNEAITESKKTDEDRKNGKTEPANESKQKKSAGNRISPLAIAIPQAKGLYLLLRCRNRKIFPDFSKNFPISY